MNLDTNILNLRTMDEEDDDFYDPADAVPVGQTPNNAQQPPAESKPQNANEDEEEVEVEDDEVSHGLFFYIGAYNLLMDFPG